MVYNNNVNRLMLVKEDEYKNYFETASMGVVYLDSVNKVKNINAEAERICEVNKSCIIGKRASEVFKNCGERFVQLFMNPPTQEAYSANVQINNGVRSSYIQINLLKIIDNRGMVGGSILIMQDVSAVYATLKQIQTTQMLLSLGELAAGVAHHVRTPLTTISGYLQLMLNRLENDRYTVKRNVLEHLLGEVGYINDVVKELVLFAKPAINKSPGVNVGKIVNEALLLTFREMGSESIQLERQIVTGLPLINGDETFLQQAFVNILQNSFEAIGDNGTITVKTWRDYESNMLVVSIADSGAGIPVPILSRVMEPFYTTKLDRMGLGLPIANRIVVEHNGFMNITNGNGTSTGAKINIYLPIVSAEDKEWSMVQQQILNLQ